MPLNPFNSFRHFWRTNDALTRFCVVLTGVNWCEYIRYRYYRIDAPVYVVYVYDPVADDEKKQYTKDVKLGVKRWKENRGDECDFSKSVLETVAEEKERREREKRGGEVKEKEVVWEEIA